MSMKLRCCASYSLPMFLVLASLSGCSPGSAGDDSHPADATAGVERRIVNAIDSPAAATDPGQVPALPAIPAILVPRIPAVPPAPPPV